MTMKNWPIDGDDGTALTATQTSQAVQVVPAGGGDLRRLVSEDVMIDNPGPADVYVRAGAANVVATLASVRVPAGSLQPYRKGRCTHIAVVCAAGLTQIVVFHLGEGA